jgi:hypothetical protein
MQGTIMPVEKALNHFTGKEGFESLNCAQSVLAAFATDTQVTHEVIREFKSAGHGRSDDGRCGALKAAHFLSQSDAQREAADQRFLDLAGSTQCREIRKGGKLSCAGCVKAATEFLLETK